MEILLQQCGNKFGITFHDGDATYAPSTLQGIGADTLDEIVSRKTNTKGYKGFELVVNTLGYDKFPGINSIASTIAVGFKDLMKEKKEEVVDERIEVSMEELKPSALEEVSLCTVMMGHYGLENPVWVLVVGAPGSGKTRAFDLLNDTRLTHWGSKVTENALLPGVPNAETTPSRGVLEKVDMRCLIFNESSVFFSGNKDRLQHQTALLTDAYSGRITIDDAGGDSRTVNCRFTALWGLTVARYRQVVDRMADFGMRFLVFMFPTDRKTHWDDFEKNEKRKQFVSMVLNTIDAFPQFLTMDGVSKEVLDEIEKFVQRITILRSLMWAELPELSEGTSRLAQQLLHLVIARAMLWRRMPTVEDVNFMKTLAVSTIPHIELIFNMLDAQGTQVYANAEKQGIVIKGKMEPGWHKFIESLKTMEVTRLMDTDLVKEMAKELEAEFYPDYLDEENDEMPDL